MFIDDKSLCRIFKVLFKDLKNKADNGEYPIFPPEKIEILRRGKIRFESKNGADDLRESLRLLGVTIYHVATGESEHNKECYAIDGYTKPLESELWPALDLMLSGNACSIPQIEDMARTRIQIGKAIKNALLWPLKMLWLVLGAIIVRPVRFMFGYLKRHRQTINEAATLILFLASVAEIGFYLWFCWPFSSLGLFIFTAIHAIVVIVLTALALHEKINYAYGPLLLAGMCLYAASSFIYISEGSPFITTEMGPAYKINDDLIMVERKTGEFTARLPKLVNDKFLAWDKRYINHFKHKVTAGVPRRGVIETALELNQAFYHGVALPQTVFSLPVKIDYQITGSGACNVPGCPKGNYAAILNKYKTREPLEQEVRKQLQKLNKPMSRHVAQAFAEFMAGLRILNQIKPEAMQIPMVFSGLAGKLEPQIMSALENHFKSTLDKQILSLKQEQVENRLVPAFKQYLEKSLRDELWTLKIPHLYLWLNTEKWEEISVDGLLQWYGYKGPEVMAPEQVAVEIDNAHKGPPPDESVPPGGIR
ncbi:hypothetical protein KJ969_03640 [Patescibacteria group bacterium]|nr:hypothetical protein [Patescibacteria group bacterium]MBU1921994.1 hypothetical protein [Patescibacteria group bacterium]